MANKNLVLVAAASAIGIGVLLWSKKPSAPTDITKPRVVAVTISAGGRGTRWVLPGESIEVAITWIKAVDTPQTLRLDLQSSQRLTAREGPEFTEIGGKGQVTTILTTPVPGDWGPGTLISLQVMLIGVKGAIWSMDNALNIPSTDPSYISIREVRPSYTPGTTLPISVEANNPVPMLVTWENVGPIAVQPSFRVDLKISRDCPWYDPWCGVLDTIQEGNPVRAPIADPGEQRTTFIRSIPVPWEDSGTLFDVQVMLLGRRSPIAYIENAFVVA